MICSSIMSLILFEKKKNILNCSTPLTLFSCLDGFVTFISVISKLLRLSISFSSKIHLKIVFTFRSMICFNWFLLMVRNLSSLLMCLSIYVYISTSFLKGKKNLFWDFGRDYTESTDTFGRNCHVKSIMSSMTQLPSLFFFFYLCLVEWCFPQFQ